MAVLSPPVLTSEHTNLDNFETGLNLTPHDTDKEKKSTALRKRAARPTSLVLSSEENHPEKGLGLTQKQLFLIPIYLGTQKPPLPAVWKPPPLLQIVSHPTPDLVRKLTTSCIPYVSSLARHIGSRTVECVKLIFLIVIVFVFKCFIRYMQRLSKDLNILMQLERP